MHAPQPPRFARQRPLRRAEYEKLVELGAFRDEKLELVYGRLVEMSPHGREHSYSLTKLSGLLIPALQGRATVRTQLPFIAVDESEPEPDVAVLPPGDYLEAHPSCAFLLIEVADSSLAYDRFTKGPLYASSGVPVYWIVNLVDMVIEVYRDPVGGTYSTVTRHERGDALPVPSFEEVVVAVADVLPRSR
jgi:Uma2 family endonuclease